ncbi:MAG: hypothetical protein ACTHL8_12915 [Burkholderiaceae bacterium]
MAAEDGRGRPAASPRPYDAEQSARQLAALIRASLAVGHTRVALQRSFMLLCLCGSLPDDLAPVVEDGIARRPLREIRRMKRAARAWAAMLGARGSCRESEAD